MSGVNFENIHNSNINIEGDVIGGDKHTHLPRALRACPTPFPPPDTFGGRDNDLAALIQTLREGKDSAITAVHGGGGIGKTTLAKKVAYEVHKQGLFRAVLWVTLNQSPNIVSLLAEWGLLADGQFEIKNRSLPALVNVVRDLLTDLITDKCAECEGNRVLVVLDNVWQDGQSIVKHLRNSAPANSTLLLTTRSEQVAIALRTTRHSLDYLKGVAAIHYLAEYLPDASSDALAALATTLGGYPLAMTLAATRVQMLALDAGMNTINALERATANYADGIPADRTFTQLHLEAGDNAEENLTLSLSYSYHDLKPDDQRRFRQLGVLPLETEFDLMLLERLWEESDHDTLEDYCRTLRLTALLTSAEEAGWYRQHRLLRAYARALLRQADEFEAMAKQGMEALNQVGQILDRWGIKLKALRYYEGASVLANTLVNQRWIAITLNNIGGVWDDLGEKHKALGYFDQALLLQQELGEKRGEATTLNNMGMVWDALGEKRKALGYYDQALPLRRQVGDKGGEATTLNNMGMVWDDLGEKYKALEYYEQALTLYEQVWNKGGEATTLSNIGMVWDALGEKRKALGYYDQALPLQQEVGDKGGEATTLNNMGMVWADLGEKYKALGYFKKALPLYTQIGDKGGEARTLNNIGWVWGDLGEQGKALRYYEQALPLRRQVGDKGGEAATLNNIGMAWADLGEKHKALGYYDQALPLLQEVEDKGGEARTLNNMGMVWDALGEKRKALGYYKQALPLQQQVWDKEGEAVTCFNMGVVYSMEGDIDKAIEYVARCVELMGVVEHPSLEIAVNTLATLQNRKRTQQTSSLSNTLPNETLQVLTANTVSACTQVTNKRDEWQSVLENGRVQIIANGGTESSEATFIDALIAIVQGNPITLPPDNPYAVLVIQIQAAIADYHIGQGNSEV